jgi:hypothetical protein
VTFINVQQTLLVRGRDSLKGSREALITQLSAVCANGAKYEAAGCVGSLRSLGKSRGSYMRCPGDIAVAHRSAEYGNR